MIPNDFFSPNVRSPPAGSASSQEVTDRLVEVPQRARGFSVRVRHRGGIEARTGLDLQDRHATGQILRLLRDDERRALSVRLEGAGDVDVLAVNSEGCLTEEYRQVKGRREGQPRWTISGLRDQGVWSEFIRHAVEFARRAEPDRHFSCVFVTDGDLDATLQALRADPAWYQNGADTGCVDQGRSSGRAALRGQILASCALGLLAPVDAARVRSSAGTHALKQTCATIALVLDCAWNVVPGQRRGVGGWPASAAVALSDLAAIGADDAALFSSAVEEAARHMDLLIGGLRFESRLSRSGDAPERDASPSADDTEAILALVEFVHLDTRTAREAYQKLRTATSTQSLHGATVDEGVLRRIIDIPAPLQLHPFPESVTHRVTRAELEFSLLGALRTTRAAWVYGPARTGKTEAVRAAVQMAGLRERTVWLSALGDGGDIERVWAHLSFWSGERSGNHELYRALRRGGVAAIEARQRIPAEAGGTEAVLVVDNGDLIAPGERRGFLAAIAELHAGGVTVVVVAGDRWGVAAGSPMEGKGSLLQVGGLSDAEASQLWWRLGKQVADLDAGIALTRLVHRVGGHPEILRMVAVRLSAKTTAEEIDAQREGLPVGEGATLLQQLARTLFHSKVADEFQRGLLERMAVLTHSVSLVQAQAIAKVNPPLRWSPFSWVGLVTDLLDQSRPGLFRIPDVYQAIARMEVEEDRETAIAVHKACADAVIKRAVIERSLDWTDLYEATLDYIFALDWENAASNAFWLARDVPPFPAADERLHLALVPFRSPAAATAGLEPDLHIALLGSLIEVERRMGADSAGQTLAAMHQVAAAATGEAGYRARAVAAFFHAADAFQTGNYARSAEAVTVAWQEAAERGDELQIRMLGEARVIAAANGAGGPSVIEEQIQALEAAGVKVTSLPSLLINPSIATTIPAVYSRPITRGVASATGPVIKAYTRYLADFRSRRMLDGAMAVAPTLAAILHDGGQPDQALTLARELVHEVEGSEMEGRAVLLLADLLRAGGQWSEARAVYERARSLLSPARSAWLRGAEHGIALALHHLGEDARAARHAWQAYRLLARDPNVETHIRFEALGRVSVLLHRAGEYRLSAAILPRLAYLAARAGNPKRLRLVTMMARRIAEMCGMSHAWPGYTLVALTPEEVETSTPGAYFFEQDLDGVGMVDVSPAAMAGIMYHRVAETLLLVGLNRRARSVGLKAIRTWRRVGHLAEALWTYDILRYADDRLGDVTGALQRAWDVLPLWVQSTEEKGYDRCEGEQAVLNLHVRTPLVRVAGLPAADAKHVLDGFEARIPTLSPSSRGMWRAEVEVARARVRLTAGDRAGAEQHLSSALEVVDGTPAFRSVQLEVAKLRAFGFWNLYSRTIKEALRLQVEFAELAAESAPESARYRDALGGGLNWFWNEKVDRSHPLLDMIARLFWTRREESMDFRTAAAALIATLDLLDVPVNVGSTLAEHVLDGDVSALADPLLAPVVRRYILVAMSRSETDGGSGGAAFAREEQFALVKRLQPHWTRISPWMDPEVLNFLNGWGLSAQNGHVQ